jgi:hypothetical protein
MKFGTGAAAIVLAALVAPLHAADSEPVRTAAALAALMVQERLSNGFEARMNVYAPPVDGYRELLLKFALVAQIGKDTTRLAARGISPEPARNRVFVAELRADGTIAALTHDAGAPREFIEVDPFRNLFGTNLFPWDLLGAWWTWPNPKLGESERVAGHECVNVRFLAVDGASPISEVISCIDVTERIAWRTRLLDRKRALIRSISVEQTMRRESGSLAARSITIKNGEGRAIQVEAYSGDEHYSIPAETFSALHEIAIRRR